MSVCVFGRGGQESSVAEVISPSVRAMSESELDSAAEDGPQSDVRINEDCVVINNTLRVDALAVTGQAGAL